MPQVSFFDERKEPTVVGGLSKSTVRKAVNGWGRLWRLLATLAAPPSGMPKEIIESASGSEPRDYGWAEALRADAGLPARMM